MCCWQWTAQPVTLVTGCTGAGSQQTGQARGKEPTNDSPMRKTGCWYRAAFLNPCPQGPPCPACVGGSYWPNNLNKFPYGLKEDGKLNRVLT